MFDMNNLGDLMKKAREVQENMTRVQEEMGRRQITAEAGGGMCTATVNGRLELVKLKIDKSKIDVNDTELLEDVVVAAVHAAQVRAAGVLKEEMARKAQEMGLPPGMLPG